MSALRTGHAPHRTSKAVAGPEQPVSCHKTARTDRFRRRGGYLQLLRMREIGILYRRRNIERTAAKTLSQVRQAARF